MFRRILSLALIAVFVMPVFSQVTDKKDPAEEAEKLRKEAVVFLRETMSEVANMRTLENRISFSGELAGLMWFHDEREARVMFNTAISDFRELLGRLDQQMNMMPDEDGPRSYGLFGDSSGRGKIEMKYRVAMAVRQQIAASIAEHDPDLALSFYYDTTGGITKESLRKQYAGMDSYFEFNLLGQIAEKNAAKAAQFGARSLEKGFNYQHVDLLRKIYQRDPERGIEFGQKILSKIKSAGKMSDHAVALIDFGVDTLETSRKTPGKKPVYTEVELRDLAETFAEMMLRPTEKFNPSTALEFASTIERVTPTRAAQLRAKYRSANSNSNTSFTAMGPPPSRLSNSAANAYAVRGEGSGYGSANGAPSTSNEGQSAEEKLMTDVVKIGKGELPKEEREKAVAQARKILMQTQGKDKQIMGLSMLAAQVSRAGDKELATEIMRDAEGLVNPNPKNYQDFIYTWMLAAGYAESNPDKAFPILEDAIGRANNLITAFVSIGEFIDVTEEMIADGEVQVGAFGGGMIRGLSKELGVAESTLQTLTKADFEKTKALTNRFDRAEVRVLAKMLVLRSVLGKKSDITAQDKIKESIDLN